MPRYWITKHVCAEPVGEIMERELKLNINGNYGYDPKIGFSYRIGHEAFLCYEDAVKNATRRRDRRAASLKRQYDRLLAMKLKPVRLPPPLTPAPVEPTLAPAI